MTSVCFLLSVLLAWFVCSYHYDACLYLYHRASYGENLTVGHSLHLMCGTGRHAHESVGTEHLCILPHSDAYASTPYKKKLVHRRMAVPLSPLSLYQRCNCNLSDRRRHFPVTHQHPLHATAMGGGLRRDGVQISFSHKYIFINIRKCPLRPTTVGRHLFALTFLC